MGEVLEEAERAMNAKHGITSVVVAGLAVAGWILCAIEKNHFRPYTRTPLGSGRLPQALPRAREISGPQRASAGSASPRPAARTIIINGRTLSDEDVLRLNSVPRPPDRGQLQHDRPTGARGIWGGPTMASWSLASTSAAC
jgi:hypothetical protein